MKTGLFFRNNAENIVIAESQVTPTEVKTEKTEKKASQKPIEEIKADEMAAKK